MSFLRNLLLLLSILSAAAQQQPHSPSYTIAGIVVDHLSGHPLSGVLVGVSPVVQNTEPVVMVTAADGRFSFPNLSAGKYTLGAERRGGRSQFYLQHGPYSTAIVTGPALDSEHIVFPFTAAPRLSGTVLDSDGDPVANAQVMLFCRDTLNGFSQFTGGPRQNTSPSGAFHFSNLEPSNCYVAVQGQPWYAQHPNLSNTPPEGAPEPIPPPAEMDVTYPITYSGDTTDPSAAQLLQLAEGASIDLRITMHAVPAVNLLVKTAGDSSQNMSASLEARGPAGVRLPVGFTRGIGPAGLQLSAVPPGHYELTANRGDHPVRRNIDVTSNSTIDLSKDDPAPITGRVTLEGSGALPGGVMVLLTSEGNVGQQAVKSDGSFSLNDSLSPGRYQVFLENAPGLYVESLSLNGSKLPGDFVDVPSSGALQLSIVAAHVAVEKVEGVVEHDGKPAPAAMVLLIPEDLAHTGLIRRDQSDSDGTFSLPEVAPGRYAFLAIDGEPDLAYRDPAVIKPYLVHAQRVTISPGFSQELKVNLSHRER